MKKGNSRAHLELHENPKHDVEQISLVRWKY